MEPALEGDQAGPPGGVAGELDRPFHRFGAAIREEDLVELAGRQRRDPLRQLDGRLVGGDDGDVHQVVELFVRGLQHLRMAVPQRGDTYSRRVIEMTSTLDREQANALLTV